MLDYGFFLDLAIILAFAKVFSLFTKKIHLPQVIGAIVAGIIIGPSCLNLVTESDFLLKMSELGVILLMFTAGLETDMKQIKETSKASLIIASIGVIVPVTGGFLVTAAFGGFDMERDRIIQYVFMGVVLAATSVSITVETLRELGKIKTKTATAIMAAAVIDDIIGIVILTISISLKDATVNIWAVIMRMFGFFLFAIFSGLVFNRLFKYMSERYGRRRRVPIYSLTFCLVMSFVAEEFFGIADITGAYLAGMIISSTNNAEYTAGKIDVASYMLFSPIFFASVGFKTSFANLDMGMIWFSLAFLAVAIVTKIAGCGLGALACKFSKTESLIIGVGMVTRGEVALIVAQKGEIAGIISPQMLTPIVFLVIITALVTPVFLKILFGKLDLRARGALTQPNQQPNHIEL